MARKHQVGPDVSLFAGGILDSLGVLDLVSALEREFAITVSDDDLLPENFHSISRIAAFVEGKLPVAPRPAPHDRAVRQGNDRNDA